MSSITFFFIFVCIIAVLFLALNFFLAPRNPYYEKISAFECGFHSFLQTRLPFNISFFIYALLFLLFDLELLLVYPFVVSAYNNEIYGLIILLIFLSLMALGFVFELGKGALKINSKQNSLLSKPSTTDILYFISSGNNIYHSNKVRKFTTLTLYKDKISKSFTLRYFSAAGFFFQRVRKVKNLRAFERK